MALQRTWLLYKLQSQDSREEGDFFSKECYQSKAKFCRYVMWKTGTNFDPTCSLREPKVCLKIAIDKTCHIWLFCPKIGYLAMDSRAAPLKQLQFPDPSHKICQDLGKLKGKGRIILMIFRDLLSFC